MSRRQKLKIVVIGDVGTGKSWFCHQFTHDTTPVKGYRQTIGVDYSSKQLFTASGTELCIELWDTAGQERFKSFVPQYFRDAHAVLVVFDSTKEHTYKSVPEWVAMFRDVYPTRPCVLVANKCDMVSHCFYETSRSTVESISRLQGFTSFHEVSALSGMNVDQTMRSAVAHILEHNRELTGSALRTDSMHNDERITLLSGGTVKKNGCAC